MLVFYILSALGPTLTVLVFMQSLMLKNFSTHSSPFSSLSEKNQQEKASLKESTHGPSLPVSTWWARRVA